MTLPGLTTGNVATESMPESEAVQRMVEHLTRVVSEFREADMRKKLKECQGYRIPEYHHTRNYVEGDKVWYQPLNGIAWFGPAAVLCQRGASVWLHAQGDIKKVAASRVKPYKLVDEVDDKKEELSNDLKTLKSCDQGLAPGMKSSYKENVGSCRGSPKDERPRRQVMMEDGLKDVDSLHAELAKDLTGARCLKADNSVCFLDFCTYVIELPVSEHWRPEVIAAKQKEIENLMDYETFEEVADEGQNVIGSRWVITVKEKHDGQKQQCKARLVARGFQESLKPQSDSPTASKDSFKLLMAVAANNRFQLALVDIRAAFLQSKALDRDVFVKPPEDIRKSGIVWRLKKPLYGLDDASRKFWLRVKEVLVRLGLRGMTGDKAFYYLHEDGELKGTVLTHVDDFSLAGDEEFIKKVISQVERQLTVSKVEKDKF